MGPLFFVGTIWAGRNRIDVCGEHSPSAPQGRRQATRASRVPLGPPLTAARWNDRAALESKSHAFGHSSQVSAGSGAAPARGWGRFLGRHMARKLILSMAASAANIVIRGARPDVCRPSLDKRHRPSPALLTCLQSVLSFHSLDSFAKATARQSAGSCQAFVPLTKECSSRTPFVAKPRNVYGGSESNPGFRSVPQTMVGSGSKGGPGRLGPFYWPGVCRPETSSGQILLNQLQLHSNQSWMTPQSGSARVMRKRPSLIAISDGFFVQAVRHGLRKSWAGTS